MNNWIIFSFKKTSPFPKMAKAYNIGKLKQLIDLNGESINFEIQFRVTSQNKEPFDLLVVSQTELDNNPNIPYKRVENGEITGQVMQNKNVYQNYFLILRADNPCVCNVEINKKELPKTQIVPEMKVVPPPPKTEGMNWTKILFFGAVIIVGGICLYWFSRKTPSSPDLADSTGEIPKMNFSMTPVRTVAPATNSLLDRLKNLQLS
jgi:hypothetical protein